jgi:hypothetical protein
MVFGVLLGSDSLKKARRRGRQYQDNLPPEQPEDEKMQRLIIDYANQQENELVSIGYHNHEQEP